MAASCFCAEAASKIAPYEPDALPELGVTLFEVLDMFSHVQILHRKDATWNVKLRTFQRRRVRSAPFTEIA